ncbi:MAG: hypothetical protein A3E84_01260 [Gammaproteobacteria bacterium RIFCSPHIGHO2_12_FULL_42_13]|nr:MAG: hypothetical protein A3E84_01260 [Gammaproteobacteria bacterium RIFCSPHIGHO2_12_FULL_42_13]
MEDTDKVKYTASFITATLIFILTQSSIAVAAVGLDLYYPLYTFEPTTLNGYGFGVWYDPEKFSWKNFRLYFETDYYHWWVTRTTFYHSTSVFSIVPILRYEFKNSSTLVPYLEISIGPAYFTKNRLEYRRLGGHVLFQDRIGIGATLGKTKNFSIELDALHFSNGSFCDRNSGITVPVMLNIGYRFL